jgi:predicted lipoprotein with Yx(FWY)xxD motif
MKTKFLLFSLTVLALIVSACASATPMPPVATSAPVQPPAATSAPVVVPVTGSSTDTPSAAMPGGPATVNVGQDATLGSFLVDSKGMSLYMFTKDTANTSNCSGTCASNWPPLLSNGAPVAGSGVTASLLGTITRADGTSQVTYNSLPLYYFAADKAAGDTKGQAVKDVWYVLDPTGKPIMTAPAAAAASASAGALVNLGQNAALGSFLVDSKGMTLYLFTKDSPNTSACYGGCASYWPPLLTSGAPAAGTGVTASMLGTTKRTDGAMQVTYNGWPLYYYVSDKAAGDTTGENVQGVWFVITPAGVQK